MKVKRGGIVLYERQPKLELRRDIKMLDQKTLKNGQEFSHTGKI